VAINPSSDLVLGSVLAADPDKYRAAVERLRRVGVTEIGATALAAGPDTRAAQPSSAPAAASDPQPASATPAPEAASRAAAKKPDAFGQLEAFVLQSFIQTMLPTDAQAFFGKGTAGAIWKSMLAEKLGAQLASSNQVGLAKRLAAGRSASASGISSVQSVRMSPSLLSALPYIEGSTLAKSSGRS
jgi:hypothetical protein